MDNYLAIIDLGSNSARLVIYRQSERGVLFESDNIKRVLRLSGHLGRDGRLDAAGVQIAIDAMRQFKQLCDARGVREIIGVATAAVRQASNGPELIRQIREATGIDVRIVSGEQEAYYGYLAVVNSMNHTEAYTVDIGGGSTEITYFKDRQLIERISFPFGAVTLTQRFLPGEVVTAERLQRLEAFLIREFSQAGWLTARGVPLIALGGGARNMANMHQKKRKYSMSSIHHYVMDERDVTEQYHLLASTPLEKRRKIKGLSSDRGDIIVATGAVFHVLQRLTGAKEFVVSTKGLRDGVLFERIREGQGTPLIDDVSLYSARHLMARYHINRASAEHVAMLALSLFDQLRAHNLLPGVTDEDRKLMGIAALLYDAGLSINVYETRQHTFYLLSNVLLTGLTHRERLTVALLASYKNDKKLKSVLVKHADLIDSGRMDILQRLGQLLWLCRTLDRSMTQSVKRLELTRTGSGYRLTGYGMQKDLVEYTLLRDILDQLAHSYQQRIEFCPVEET